MTSPKSTKPKKQTVILYQYIFEYLCILLHYIYYGPDVYHYVNVLLVSASGLRSKIISYIYKFYIKIVILHAVVCIKDLLIHIWGLSGSGLGLYSEDYI